MLEAFCQTLDQPLEAFLIRELSDLVNQLFKGKLSFFVVSMISHVESFLDRLCCSNSKIVSNDIQIRPIELRSKLFAYQNEV